MSEIKKKLNAIDRRTFLKGVGNVVIALPFMDFMLGPSGEALAQTGMGLPKRYLIVYNGISLGAGSSRFNPTTTGANWTPSTSLAPVNNFPMLKPYLTLVTNLSIPYQGNVFNNGPGWGVDTNFHSSGVGNGHTQLTASAAGEKMASSDQLLKTNLGLGSEFVHMNYTVQPKPYFGGEASTMQFSSTGQGLAPQRDPSQAFTAMVTGIKENDTSAETARLAQLTERKSVLDLIDKRRVEYLNKVFGTDAKARLSDHFDRLRDLEKQVSADLQNTTVVTSTCKKSTAPPTNLPLGSDYVGTHPIENNITDTMGWSDETRRSQLFREIVAMGMSCDRARVGTMRMTYDQSFISAQQLIGAGKGSGRAKDYHETTHGTGTIDDLAMCTAWHVNEFLKLAEALRTMPEGAGNVLDNTVLLFLSDGGWGSTSDKSGMVPHSGDNMAVLLAGRAGGIKSGTHIKANKEHTCEVIFAAMKAAGYSGTSFNRISKEFAGIR